MRNEELEQHLQRWMQRCWSLKQVILEQQNLIKAQAAERLQYHRHLKRTSNEAEHAYSFAKFECEKYRKVVCRDKIIQGCQDMLERGRQTAKEFTSRDRFNDDRYRKVCQARDQKQIELEEGMARLESMRVENEYVVKNLDRVQFETQEKLHHIHELLDPQTSIHTVGKSYDYTADMVKQAVSKLHSLVAQSDVKSREIVEMHAVEMREL